MDFSKYSFWELNKLYFQIGDEYLKRIWWLILILVIASLFFTLYKSKKR